MSDSMKNIITGIILMFLVPWLFMLIWNHIMPSLCNFNEITYWQSFWLGIGLRLIDGTLGLRRVLDNLK